MMRLKALIDHLTDIYVGYGDVDIIDDDLLPLVRVDFTDEGPSGNPSAVFNFDTTQA